jgi:hypothetical protein
MRPRVENVPVSWVPSGAMPTRARLVLLAVVVVALAGATYAPAASADPGDVASAFAIACDGHSSSCHAADMPSTHSSSATSRKTMTTIHARAPTSPSVGARSIASENQAPKAANAVKSAPAAAAFTLPPGLGAPAMKQEFTAHELNRPRALARVRRAQRRRARCSTYTGTCQPRRHCCFARERGPARRLPSAALLDEWYRPAFRWWPSKATATASKTATSPEPPPPTEPRAASAAPARPTGSCVRASTMKPSTSTSQATGCCSNIATRVRSGSKSRCRAFG